MSNANGVAGVSSIKLEFFGWWNNPNRAPYLGFLSNGDFLIAEHNAQNDWEQTLLDYEKCWSIFAIGLDEF